MASKSEIRKAFKNLNKSYSECYKTNSSELIMKTLEESSLFNNSENILLFFSLPDEVITHDIILHWSKTKNIFLPKVDGDNIEIIKFNTLSELSIGAFGILEPAPSAQRYTIDNIDLVLVPAVCISRSGKRIGRGKGYYDRLLCNSTVTKIGTIYSKSICEDFESDNFDVKMDYLLTELGLTKISK